MKHILNIYSLYKYYNHKYLIYIICATHEIKITSIILTLNNYNTRYASEGSPLNFKHFIKIYVLT